MRLVQRILIEDINQNMIRLMDQVAEGRIESNGSITNKGKIILVESLHFGHGFYNRTLTHVKQCITVIVMYSIV